MNEEQVRELIEELRPALRRLALTGIHYDDRLDAHLWDNRQAVLQMAVAGGTARERLGAVTFDGIARMLAMRGALTIFARLIDQEKGRLESLAEKLDL